MLGLGKYKVNIDHMFYTGVAVFEIKNDEGNYEIDIELENNDFEMPDIELKDVIVEVDTIIAKAEIDEFPGKAVDVNLTFTDDKCNGFLKIPFVGKIKIKDAVKIG